MGRHRVHGPCPLSRSCVPSFGISGQAGLASPQIPEQISGLGRGSEGAQRKRQKRNIVWQVEQRESDLNNRILGVWSVCEREGEEKKTEKKRGERPHSPLRGPHSPCHVVSTASAGESGQGREDPIGPSLSCASPVSGVCPLDACVLFKSCLVGPHPCGPEGQDQLEVSE